jgi:class 3 adenylate cyclase/tetratricopeptide (TPR) repeat protein
MGRVTAVVLFTDLVGSTELRGRLGEDAADELRRKHDQLLAQAVESNNGRVVKGLGDGIMATFAGASDGVAAAVAIQQSVDRLNRSGRAAVPLAVRVGLSAGDVGFEDDDVHGTPVIEASRLCAAAAGGEILAAEVVRVLAGSTAHESFVPVGPLELKGLDHPVAAVRVEWEPAIVSSIPMPQLLTDVGRIFVGRDAELERLAQLWKEAAAGERRVALLAGEPGVGKTRLAAEVAIRVHDEGGVVTAGRCDEDLGVPYQPFVEALRHFVDHTPRADLKERLGRYGGELTRLVPELVGLVVDLPPPLKSDPEMERYRLFDAVAAWLSAASSEQPVVLVLDDLQWAAKPTLLLLRHVLRAPDVKRLLILATYRDTELTHDHPLVDLVADLRRDAGFNRLPISGLDDLAVATMVEQVAGRALDGDGFALARTIYQETEGNPFFVREVLRHLAETDAVEWRGNQWAIRLPSDQIGIPEGVRDVVGRRLSRLSAGANQALRVAAVVGAEFEVALVQAAGPITEGDLLAALDEAVEARLVGEVSPTRFRFSHALVRATLYDSLTGARKMALHRSVAEAIEGLHQDALDDHLPALAHHWTKAAAPAAETERAVEYATRAGDRALALLAHDEAVTYYGQALELMERSAVSADGHQLELLIKLGDAQRRAGDPAHRATLLVAGRRAKEQGDASAVVRAALANSRGALYSAAGAIDAERVAALEDALAVVGQEDPPVRARLLAHMALELTWAERERRSALSDEALTLARSVSDRRVLAEVLIARPYAIAAPDTLGERLADTAELLALTTELGDAVAYARALALRFRVAVESADAAEADRCVHEAERITAELGQPALRWLAAMLRVGWEVLAGRFEDADRWALHALELGHSTGQPDAEPLFVAQQAVIRFEQGRLDEILEGLRHYPDQLPLRTARSVLAAALAETGRFDEAAAALDTVARPDFGDVPFDALWLRTLTDCAAVSVAISDHTRARNLQAMLAPYAEQVPAFAFGTPSGCVSHFLGLLASGLGDHDEADRRFADAETIHGRIGAPAWLARTRLEWARMLLTRRQPGDADRARELLGQALATARELGLAKVERDAVALLT